jgi:hypothetical protein
MKGCFLQNAQVSALRQLLHQCAAFLSTPYIWHAPFHTQCTDSSHASTAGSPAGSGAAGSGSSRGSRADRWWRVLLVSPAGGTYLESSRTEEHSLLLCCGRSVHVLHHAWVWTTSATATKGYHGFLYLSRLSVYLPVSTCQRHITWTLSPLFDLPSDFPPPSQDNRQCHLHKLGPTDLSMLVWSMAHVGWRGELPLLSAVAARAETLLPQFKQQELSNVLWAMATLLEGADVLQGGPTLQDANPAANEEEATPPVSSLPSGVERRRDANLLQLRAPINRLFRAAAEWITGDTFGPHWKSQVGCQGGVILLGIALYCPSPRTEGSTSEPGEPWQCTGC